MLYFIHLLVNTGIVLFTIKGKDQIAVSLYVPDTGQNQQKERKGSPGCPLHPPDHLHTKWQCSHAGLKTQAADQ